MERIKAGFTLLCALVFAAAPVLAPDFTGYQQGDLPIAVTDPPFQPAAWAFSIWMLIYAALIGMAVFGAWKRQSDAIWASTRAPLILSMALGTSWLFVAQMAPVTATLIIWLMLASSLTAFFAARPSADRWLLRAPLAIYTGWLTAASGVASGSIIAGYAVLSPVLTALIVLMVVAAIGLVVQLSQPGTPEYAGAIIWALVGIVVGNLAGEVVVSAVAVLAIAIMAMAALRAA